MSLLQEIQARTGRQPCSFGRWAVSASQGDRGDLAVAFADQSRGRASGQVIADVLASRIEGWIVDYVRKHRRGTCTSCPPTFEYLNIDFAAQHVAS